MKRGSPISPLTQQSRRSLDEGWSFLSTEASVYTDPREVEAARDQGLAVVPARVPCTVASALRDAGRIDASAPEELHVLDDQDHWFHCRFESSPDSGKDPCLSFDGLATHAEVWLNGTFILASESMFISHEVDVGTESQATNDLWICFRALSPLLAKKRPRARWRTQLVKGRNLRFQRTTLFGRIASWCPPIPPVGPWGAIEFLTREANAGCVMESSRLRASLDGGNGVLEFAADCTVDPSFDPESLDLALLIEGQRFPVQVEADASGSVRLSGGAYLEGVERWWPHTALAEGESPRRYAVSLRVGGTDGGPADFIELGSVGFRSVVQTGSDRFALSVNGQPIFCRGTCWTPLDSMTLHSDPAVLRAALEEAVAAGMNMLRVTGTIVYESDAFYDLCDELGILVWQDFMFATFDYPTDDPAFRGLVDLEVDQFLSRTAGRACLAVFCGNSEGQQQPAMLGLEPGRWASEFFDEGLRDLCDAVRPDVPYWVSTPSGGVLPFHPEQGTAHYFGVGAYRRSIDDAALARPAFITECLAFAQPGGVHHVDESDPKRVPRDRGADWDFADVTDFYRDRLFPVGDENSAEGADNEDDERKAFRTRAALAEVMRSTQNMWRAEDSDCAGSLVLMHRDPWECAGWGVFDHSGTPKSGLYGLAQAWAPIAVTITDRGLSGLHVRVINDRNHACEAELSLRLLRFDGTCVEQVSEPIVVSPRSSWEGSVEGLLGGFVDAGHAYGFGEPGFNLCVAELIGCGDGPGLQSILAPGPVKPQSIEMLGLKARWAPPTNEGDRWSIEVETERFAQSIAIDAGAGRPSDNFFPLAPGSSRRIQIRGASGREVKGVTLRALNGDDEVRLGPPGETQ